MRDRVFLDTLRANGHREGVDQERRRIGLALRRWAAAIEAGDNEGERALALVLAADAIERGVEDPKWAR